jgi:hypothetical protein
MSQLREELAAKKNLCLEVGRQGHAVSFIEFRPDPHTRTGFAASQLLHYTLEAHAGDDKDAPERLSFAFHTADVVVTGARLAKLADLIKTHELASVSALDARYANADAGQPWVGKIAIERLDKPGGGAA